MRRGSRRPLTLLLACLAAALNALAPVLAYAAEARLRDATHHPAHSYGHAHHHELPAEHGKPDAPHCPYCLDFAAGAPLAPTLPPPAIVRPDSAPAPVRATAYISSRSSLRLASPRAPPSLA